MYKRILALAFVFMLAFSPVAAIAAEVDEANNSADKSEALVIESSDEEEASDDKKESDEEEDSGTDSEDANEEDPDLDEEVTASDEEANTREDETSEEAEEEEEKISTFATADEDLDLSEVFGNASGNIEYDIEKGYYVLDLRAGFTTFTSGQDIENKWVAFALPNGVKVADDLPNGVVSIFIAGKTGLAVKVPNIQGIGGETVNKKIPLTGQVDDNDPVYNTYMVNVDTEANGYEEIGELRGQREIDFSVMEENPSIDLTGSITGETKFDRSKEKVYYLLDVTVKAENDAYENLSDDLYVAFELPEGVAVLNNDDTPADLKTIRLGDNTGVALKLPKLGKGGGSQEITYSIPVIGMSDAVVQSEAINLYTFTQDNRYHNIGQFPGSIAVDFSGMDEAWYFDIKNEVITDYPGVNGNQKGFRFNYTTKNLTLDDVDEVVMEFVVPSGITIEKPQYIGGSVDVDWDGNVATVTLGDLRGGSGYYGYFTAVGTTNKSISELKDTEVTVTLFRDGETEVITLSSPFVEGAFDENDFDPIPGNGDGGIDDDDGTGNGDAGTGDDDETGDGDGGTGGTNGDGNQGNEEEEDGVTVEVEDGDDSVVDAETAASEDNELPKTATNTFTMMLFGSILILAGGSFAFVRKFATNK